MTKEQLEALGLDEEQIKEIFKLNGMAVNNAKGELDTIKAENENLKSQLDNANTQIEEFKGMDIESIKAAADEYKTKYEESKSNYEKELETIKFNHTLENALKGAKAKNVKAVKALLDLKGLKLNEDKIVGLDEQLEKLIKDNDYLFNTADDKQDNPKFTRPNTGGKAGGLTKEDFLKMDYHEKRELYNKDIELYREIAK